MGKKLIILLLLCISLLKGNAYSQITTHWVEDFSNPVSAQGTPAIGFNGWTVTNSGANGADANTWFVSCEENGNLVGQCGSACSGNATLHIGTQPVPFICPTGDCGAAYNAGGGIYNTMTHKMAVTPLIDCSCSGNPVYVDFRYLANGQPNQDYFTFEYWDGLAWTIITNPATTLTGACAPQGEWTFYSVALPLSAVNNPNVRLGFNWQNNNDGLGTDPSVAIDSIVVYSQAISYFADFTYSPASPCIGDSITFTDGSFGTVTNWSWDFGGGGSPNTSTQQNPTVLFTNAGNYVVTLTVSDNCGTPPSSNSYLVIVNNCVSLTAGFTSNNSQICQGDSIQFTDNSVGLPTPTNYEWLFPGGSPSSYIGGSGNPNPPPVTYSALGSYDVTLIIANGFSIDTLFLPGYVTVVNCTLPVANFSTPTTSFCSSTCIDFNNSSTGASTYSWSFQGATPATSIIQFPTNICYNVPGVYDVTLIVSNGTFNDTMFMPGYITVNSCQVPTAAFTTAQTAICATQCINFTDQSTSATSWTWAFAGANTLTSISQNPTNICYDTPGVYPVVLIAGNQYGFDTITQLNYITVNDCTPTAQFSALNTTGCNGDCFSITNQSTGATTWSWQFPGGNPSSFVGQNPPQICYTNPGYYDISLTVTNAYGTDSVMQDSFIHIVYCNNLHAHFAASDTFICAGDCISFVDLSTGAPIGWFWNFPGGIPDTITAQSPPYVCYPNSGIYPVTLFVFNSGGTDTLVKSGYITVNDGTPISTNIDSTTIFAGTNIQLSANGGINYLWSPTNTLNGGESTSSPVASPVDTTVYIVTMTDVNGCSSTKSILINVIPPETVWAPTGFSPNNDGNNDVFNLKASGLMTDFYLRIFDRWGELVFESKDPTIGWDGTYQNVKLNVGVYVYYYHISFIDETVIENSGDVTLLR